MSHSDRRDFLKTAGALPAAAVIARMLEQMPADTTLRTAWYPDGWHLPNRDLDAEVDHLHLEC